MHEYSIVSSLIQICEKEAKKIEADKIKSLSIKVGKLSGIEPHFMQHCFDYFKEGTICCDAVLNMQIIDVVIHCNTCDKDYKLQKNDFFCPSCNSKETEMIQGRELLVEKIELF